MLILLFIYFLIPKHLNSTHSLSLCLDVTQISQPRLDSRLVVPDSAAVSFWPFLFWPLRPAFISDRSCWSSVFTVSPVNFLSNFSPRGVSLHLLFSSFAASSFFYSIFELIGNVIPGELECNSISFEAWRLVFECTSEFAKGHF